MRTLRILGGAVVVALAVTAIADAQRGGVFRASRDHPAIRYSDGPLDNAATRLNARLERGDVTLSAAGRAGYLVSLLEALDVPVESQVAVFSKTSRQAREITSANPRSLYFADDVAVGWVRDGDEIEVAAHDPRQGTVFYTLSQGAATPRLERDDQCLACHLSWDTLGLPGWQVLSTAPLSPDPTAYATGFVTDHRSRLEDRWGGWYVTGDTGDVAHMGNVEVTDVEDPTATLGQVPPRLASLEGVIDLDGFPSAHSDVVALLVLDHQAHMLNLITRIGWEARREALRDPTPEAAEADLVREAAVELVDYLLFVDELPFPTPIVGSSDFAEVFTARGLRDSQGRSLRDLDLERRLFRYPCSYLIHSEAFDALPERARLAVYDRLWAVLSGAVSDPIYAQLSDDDRSAIVEILRETKTDLPDGFGGLTP